MDQNIVLKGTESGLENLTSVDMCMGGEECLVEQYGL